MCNKYFYFLYRLVFGTLYPAYSSYKAVKNRDVREYSRWMMYWIVFALFSFAEVFTDVFIAFWLPFYYEIKIIFILWLMSPYGNGSRVMYLNIIHPQLTRYEPTIDLYIERGKDVGKQWFALIGRRALDVANRSLFYVLHSTQTLIYYHMQSHTMAESQLHHQRLLTQPNPALQPPPGYFQKLFTRSPRPPTVTDFVDASAAADIVNASAGVDTVDGSPTAPKPLSQRWCSEGTLNVGFVELMATEVIATSGPSTPVKLRPRNRSTSESNLDDWEKMDVQTESEVKGKPPVQPKGAKKRAKVAKTPGERSTRKTRAAAVKARAKCKEALPEESSSKPLFSEDDEID